jgi:murein L,D-transpeptidase YcbB/YkuD
MGALRVFFFGLASSVVLSALQLPALAENRDGDWLSKSAFQRAQRNFQARQLEEEPFPFIFERQPRLFERQPRLFERQRARRSVERRKRFRFFDFFDNFDPEPDFSIVRGKPKSPDDGFGTYRPVKLVALSNPKLEAPKPQQVLASTILYELRRPESSLRVTEQQRDAIINFYRLNNFKPLWISSEGLTGKASLALALFSKSDEEGLNPLDYLPPTLGSLNDDGKVFRGQVSPLARLDIAVTAMALRYAEHLHSGRIIPNKLSGYYDLTPPSLSLGQVLYELSHRTDPDRYLASLAPAHSAYGAMKSTLAELRAKLARNDEEPIPAGERVNVGRRDARIPLVRSRMLKLGLLKPEAALAWKKIATQKTETDTPETPVVDEHALEQTLDPDLSKALKSFQRSQGIKQTGRLDKATVDALNMRTDERNVRKLVTNMERMRWFPRDPGSRYIFVNQAAFELRIIDNDRITWKTKVIVGKPETQTAVFSDEMETVVLNPYWGVPKSIIKYEMLPYLVNDPSYLDRKGFEVVNSRGEVISSRSVDWWAYGDRIPYDIRQPPGDDNALGNIKFLFPNSHDIYMHDTPTKDLFNEQVRAFSHGCVRVENPRKFAEFVLGWDRQQIDDLIATGKNMEIGLDRHIPVHLNYFTAWPDASGRIVFYNDGYGRDARLEKALSTTAVAAN